MRKSSTRVLIVDDHEPWRRFVHSSLNREPELQTVAEVSDGLEAVQKALELQPDLIILDIGLPGLNGMEVARQIRKLSPGSKIIFLTQESSADLVQEALKIGARGYVTKTDAGSELPEAVTAVLRGEQVVGRRFERYDFTGIAKLQTSDIPTGLEKPELPTVTRLIVTLATNSGSKE